MAIRFKRQGTGSAVAKADQVTERPIQWALTESVGTLLTNQVRSLEAPSPYEIATIGIPCFRWNGGSYIDEGLEVFPPGGKKWEPLLRWWEENAVGTDAELENLLKQLRLSSGNWTTPSPPWVNDFLYCLPFVAGNVILHRRVSPRRIDATGGSPHLHIFREWICKSFYRPLTMNAAFDMGTFGGCTGGNRLTVFVERPTDIVAKWDGSPPEVWQDLEGMRSPELITDGSNWQTTVDQLVQSRGHPWPTYEEDGVEGIVPIAVQWTTEYLNGFPAIPLSISGTGSSARLTYWTSPESFRGILQIPADGAVRWNPFRVWQDVDPANPSVSDFTPLDPLIDSVVDSPSKRPGFYRDSSGAIVAANYSNHSPAYIHSEDTGEVYGDTNVDVIGTVPITRSAAESGGDLWFGARHADIVSDYPSQLVKIYRNFREWLSIPKGLGPELVVSIDTGTGGASASAHNAITAAFVCVGGYAFISPANEDAERLWDQVVISRNADNVTTISFPFGDELEKDSYGYYYGYQYLELRFRLHFEESYSTPNDFILYPTTAAIDAPKAIPTGPFHHVGYTPE